MQQEFKDYCEKAEFHTIAKNKNIQMSKYLSQLQIYSERHWHDDDSKCIKWKNSKVRLKEE